MGKSHNTTNFEFGHVETAMCLWEAVLNIGRDELQKDQHDLWNNSGAWGVRQELIWLSPKVDKLWDSLGDDLRDEAGAFDWDFCPMLIGMMKDFKTLPTKAQIKEAIKNWRE